MHFSELTPPEQRVLGCLIEKRWTTPDQYPLSLNALRLAANQSTNRDPVTTYDEATIREAAQRLSRYGLTRLASGHNSRATKYRHLAEEGLGLGREELAVLAVLLLRGPQTPGEIKARSERMAQVGSLEAVERLVGGLIERGYVRRVRRPGQKEDRFAHTLGGSAEDAPPVYDAGVSSDSPAGTPGLGGDTAAGYIEAPAATAAPPGHVGAPDQAAGRGHAVAGSSQAAAGPGQVDLADRVDALELEVAELRSQLAALAAELGLASGDEPAGAPA
jgi:uncharacterized protein YceH (UPF0502 family)